MDDIEKQFTSKCRQLELISFMSKNLYTNQHQDPLKERWSGVAYRKGAPYCLLIEYKADESVFVARKISIFKHEQEDVVWQFLEEEKKNIGVKLLDTCLENYYLSNKPLRRESETEGWRAHRLATMEKHLSSAARYVKAAEKHLQPNESIYCDPLGALAGNPCLVLSYISRKKDDILGYHLSGGEYPELYHEVEVQLQDLLYGDPGYKTMWLSIDENSRPFPFTQEQLPLTGQATIDITAFLNRAREWRDPEIAKMVQIGQEAAKKQAQLLKDQTPEQNLTADIDLA